MLVCAGVVTFASEPSVLANTPLESMTGSVEPLPRAVQQALERALPQLAPAISALLADHAKVSAAPVLPTPAHCFKLDLQVCACGKAVLPARS